MINQTLSPEQDQQTMEGCLYRKMKSAESDPIPLYLPSVLPEVHHRKQTIQESGVFGVFFEKTINVFSKKK